jgi:hypothetical protein
MRCRVPARALLFSRRRNPKMSRPRHWQYNAAIALELVMSDLTLDNASLLTPKLTDGASFFLSRFGVSILLRGD